jgi:hypothetical protein
VLTVISGGTSASIHLSGQHTQASFQITSGVGGSAEIFDPPVGVQQTTFGSPETLGYMEKIVETAIGDIFAGKFALLCNYMASEFANTIVYCGPVLRHSAELIQAANFRSAVVF